MGCPLQEQAAGTEGGRVEQALHWLIVAAGSMSNGTVNHPTLGQGLLEDFSMQ